MDLKKFANDVLKGNRPVNSEDFGPYANQLTDFLEYLESGSLLSFHGKLDERFIQVDVREADNLMFEPKENEFYWAEDSEMMWQSEIPQDAFADKKVESAYLDNFERLEVRVDQWIAKSLPEEFIDYYESIYCDLQAIWGTIATFGKLDDFYGHAWEAYLQGGWPCGLSGVRPKPEEDFSMVDRKMYVLWLQPGL